jgi:hypothetical protein
MSTTPTHGGLFGLLKRTGAIFQNPAQTIVAMAMIAAVLTIATHAGVPIPYAAAFIAIILGLACLFAEAFTAKGVVDAFWYGRPLGAVGYTMLWCAAFGYAMMNWLGTRLRSKSPTSIRRRISRRWIPARRWMKQRRSSRAWNRNAR